MRLQIALLIPAIWTLLGATPALGQTDLDAALLWAAAESDAKQVQKLLAAGAAREAAGKSRNLVPPLSKAPQSIRPEAGSCTLEDRAAAATQHDGS